jgi:hypothetical protein
MKTKKPTVQERIAALEKKFQCVRQRVPIEMLATLPSTRNLRSGLNYYLRNTGPTSPDRPKEKEKKIWGLTRQCPTPWSPRTSALRIASE